MLDRSPELTYPEHLRGLSLPLARGASFERGEWIVLRQVRVLGFGASDFAAARERIMTWQMHRDAGLRVESEGDVGLGRRVAVSFGAGPIALAAPCEVVAVVNEEKEVGFAWWPAATSRRCCSGSSQRLSRCRSRPTTTAA
ncbi:MAG: DUF1990 family protein [Actinomycetes bacterium]